MTRYQEAGIEPALEEVLSDPIVTLLMARDGLEPGDVRDTVVAAQSRRTGASGIAASPDALRRGARLR